MFDQYSITETAEELKSDRDLGLSGKEAGERLRRDGRNEMKAPRKKTPVEAFLEQLNDPLIYVLIVAAMVSVLLREISDAVIIGVVVVLNAAVGMLQEGKARRALESLKKLTSPRAMVIRDGRRMEIPAAELALGDLVCLEAGCQVPADLRLTEASNLKIEESALTGESLPMEKDAGFISTRGSHLPLGDRQNMAYMSTIVTYGRGQGLVTAVGMNTELGQIAAMITEAKEEMTPLQRRLGELGKVLSLLSLLLCAALFVIAVLQHRNVPEMLITAISLAVAAVPEGLPAVVTICLALSVTRMVKVNTIVRRLPSVETLGAVSVVCSDKTGTLTQNRMTVEKCWFDGCIRKMEEYDFFQCPDFIYGMTLCNDASAEGGSRTGDPTELALLDAAELLGIQKSELERQMPRVDELSFDSDRKMMTTLHRQRTVPSSRQAGSRREQEKGRSVREYAGMGELRAAESRTAELRASKLKMTGPGLAEQSDAGQKRIAYTKGAPDEVLKRCTHIFTGQGVMRLTELHRRQLKAALSEMSREALRTLAIAVRPGVTRAQEENLTFLGMVGMRDPARPEAAAAVADFREAGVKTVMITGDHVDTAFAIGRQLGIAENQRQCMTGEELSRLSDEEFASRIEELRVFARVSPAQKVRIVDGFKRRGEIVAMTGDGVNDAPSLKKADIGIAMGKTGTDVARQASDMILTDDNFATIRRAIEEGRGVYENIRKSVIFLLSSNLGEIITMFLAVICGMAAPLKSSHILWINLITDSLPALALGVDRNDGRSLMKQQPRKARESLFARGGLVCTCFYGALIAAVSLTAFLMLPCALLRVNDLAVTPESLAEVLKNASVLSKAQTYAFTVLGMSQLFHAVGMRDTQKSVFRMKHLENKLMIVACVTGFLLQFAVTEIPVLIRAFGTFPLSGREWMRLSILAAAPLFAHEILVLGAMVKKRT
ncbi:cation-translocating P-type ATPase [Acetatifactor muris]|uniref:P-type Ca(2+) transporter n=1 Tax=Acetatifactor muris TaxID=879566 RepID=A0A2K4ZG29_9FIRM|nr:cation-translocating P-type ATPase [Acetatifactor muris]MCR2045678.1 cation-translocating P-type ATPase [Acetatifactor muris]SOY29415.1 Calcium-transporting ATPase 1 [Acetatifactor muris]